VDGAAVPFRDDERDGRLSPVPQFVDACAHERATDPVSLVGGIHGYVRDQGPSRRAEDDGDPDDVARRLSGERRPRQVLAPLPVEERCHHLLGIPLRIRILEEEIPVKPIPECRRVDPGHGTLIFRTERAEDEPGGSLTVRAWHAAGQAHLEPGERRKSQPSQDFGLLLA